MKRRTCILTTALLLLNSLFTWADVGSWRLHLAYHNATQCVVIADKIYVVSDGSLYSYTPADEFVETYDKSNLLNEQGIRHIAVDEQSNILVVVYNNANIDLIYPNGKVTNITDYTNASTLDPTVNGVSIVKGKAYLATNFGLTVLDVEREEFSNTYTLGKVTHSCTEMNGFIYAATAEGIYRGDSQKNLLDASNWTRWNEEVYTQLAVFKNSLLALKAKESVYQINLTDGSSTVFRKGTWHFIRTFDEKFFIGKPTEVFVYEDLSSPTRLNFGEAISDISVAGGTYWTASGAKGLNGYKYDTKSKQTAQIVSQIIPNSPIRNYCQYLNFVDDTRLLVAGGNINYYDDPKLHRNATLMMFEDGTWHTFEEDGMAARTAGLFRNMTSIVQDPLDPTHHYASSYGQGIYEYRDMKFVRQYTHKEKAGLTEVVASPLESAAPTSYNYTRISRLKYDKQGNLWITNSHAESPIKIMKPDGTFVNLYYKELERQETMGDILFDSNGWVWVVSLQGPANLFCIDLNGTLENTNDDRIKVFSENFVDQDGGSIEVYYINDLAEDHNGDIWVMTDKGPYVLYNTKNAFNDNYHFTKIKVPRNDGTNYADYLLDGTYTTSIEIDPANRKWIGTLNNGLYLVGPDGIESIHHFTKDNSPLPSNAIESLALNEQSGELFIGTDKGLVAYTTNATRGENEYIEEKVYAYPNPIAPDYNGPITIVGLKGNSNVKIVSTSGRLVAEGTSLGGSFTWDGRTPQGECVSTGIYYILGSDEEGNEGIVTKLLFIK